MNSDDTFEAYVNHLKKWPWEWTVTLTFPIEPRIGPDMANRSRLWWTRRLCVEEGLQGGYYYVLSFKKSFVHFHLLMLSRRRKGGKKTLSDVNGRYWEWRWRRPSWDPFDPEKKRNYRIAKVEPPRSIVQASGYLAKNYFDPKNDDVEFDCYNLGLLKKLMR